MEPCFDIAHLGHVEVETFHTHGTPPVGDKGD
jgi:hypothetical protein